MVRLFVSLAVLIMFAMSGCVPIQVRDERVVYIAFGDSMTDGPGAKQYHEYLRVLLGADASSFANEGQGGETSDEGVVRLQQLIEDDLYPNARVLLYWQGGKDIIEFIRSTDPLMVASPADEDYPLGEELELALEQVRANIETVIDLAHEADMDVYVATYFFIRPELQSCQALPLDIILPVQAERANDYIAELNDCIRDTAAARGVVLVDVHAASDELQADDENFHDCNHLSEHGNEIVAGLFAEHVVPPGTAKRYE